MKKRIYQILTAIIGAIIFSVIGFITFATYGGNSCDFPGKTCNCFCCNSFGMRGWESCGEYGIITGIVFGIAIGIIGYKLMSRRKTESK